MDQAPAGFDTDRPSFARVYDYMLGGAYNFAADREVAHQALASMPELRQSAQINRAFLARAVRRLSAAGVRQFLDLGSGIPTVGNVHEIAQAADPASRVVYVDIDPVAVACGRSILEGDERTVLVEADLRDVDAVLADPAVGGLLDLDAPVAVLMVAVLHNLSDEDDPAGVVARYRDATAPGSHLVVSHASQEKLTEPYTDVQAQYNRTATQLHIRTRAEIEGFFAGYTLQEPGVVYLPWWHSDGELPDDQDWVARMSAGGVGTR